MVSPIRAIKLRTNSTISTDSFANERSAFAFGSGVRDFANGDQRFMDLLEGKIKRHQSVIIAPIHVPSAITATTKANKKQD